MIIESINIKSFGKITDLSLKLDERVNVIVGENEAGKSTIAAFIKYMLYGFDNADTPEGIPDERAKRVSWGSGSAEGTMTVRYGERRYLISRSTELVSTTPYPTYKEDSSITDLETGSLAFGKVAAGEVFFGVDRELFENTAFVGQIADSAINEGSVKQSIENILFSGSEQINNRRAAAKVAEKLETLFHKSGSGGAIYDLRRRAEQLEERFRAADEDNKLILAKEAALHAIRTERLEQQDSLDRLTDLDECYRNVVVIQSFDKLHELEVRSEQKSVEIDEYVEANRRAGFVPDEDYLTELRFTRRALDDSYRALVEAEDKYRNEKRRVGITAECEAQIEKCDALGGEAKIRSDAGRERKSLALFVMLAILGGLVALAALVVEIIATGTLAELWCRILFALPGALGLALMGYSLYRISVSRRSLSALEKSFSTDSLESLLRKITVIGEERKKRDDLAYDIEAARVTHENARDAYERAKGALLDVILRWGEEPPTANLNDFLDSLEERTLVFLEGKRRLTEEKAELESSVRELRAALADKSEIDIRAQVSPLKRKVLAEIDHESILSGIEDYKQRIAEQDVLVAAQENELALLKLRATDPGELYAKMQENDSRTEALILEHAACELAKETIEKASDNLRLEISPRLGAYTAALMGVMTDRKYTDVDVSDGLMVSFVDGEGVSRSVDFLSGGTRALTYVSLRMALIDMLYSELPPVCFDESFAHQDNKRAALMMRAITALSSEGMQSLIFTCREREAALARECLAGAAVFKLTLGDDDIA